MGRLWARILFKRQLAYLRAPLSCFFNPFRLPVGLFMRFTNSAVVSSLFSRLGLDRTIIACSLCLIDRNQCAYRWRKSTRNFLSTYETVLIVFAPNYFLKPTRTNSRCIRVNRSNTVPNLIIDASEGISPKAWLT